MEHPVDRRDRPKQTHPPKGMIAGTSASPRSDLAVTAGAA